MKILLHICCGPCSIYPVEKLAQEGYSLEGLYFNPNIHPHFEFNRRKDTLSSYAKQIDLKVHYFHEDMQGVWENFEGGIHQRCRMCYTIRLRKTACFAKENGFDGISTTLLVSPYQQHDLINELGEKLASERGLKFVYFDFRDGYRSGQQKARMLNLYRQKYCGCIRSLEESPIRDKIKFEEKQ